MKKLSAIYQKLPYGKTNKVSGEGEYFKQPGAITSRSAFVDK